MALSAPLSPFCCERCRLLDLGNWAMGRYAIPVPFSENHRTDEDPLGLAQDDSGE